MARNYSKCPHMDSISLLLSPSELCKLKQGFPCSECSTCGPNLWICLHRNCLHTGCSEQANDHSTEHFKLNNQHCIHMNLSSQRIWCYLCETEAFLTQRRSSLASNNNDSSDASRYSDRLSEKAAGTNNIGLNSMSGKNNTSSGGSPDSSCDEDETGDRRLMDGLVGLQNIANTCYMNAALQALSNSPPLTYYFLDCGDIIEAASEISSNQRKPGLAKSYHRLIKDMWCRNKRTNGYVVPSGILYGIRSVHPMFRGFQQHDTQEFLRCFMDQLHEELKELTPPPPDIFLKNDKLIGDQLHNCASNNDEHNSSPCSTPSQSEAEYETCDSGVSEQSSLSDEGSNSKRRSQIYSRSPSPIMMMHNIQKGNSIKSSSSSLPDYPNSSSLSSSQMSNLNAQQQEKLASRPPHRSIISDVFDGKLLSSVQCLTCDRISTREETFQDLSLPIPGKDHLAVLHQSQGCSSNQQQLQQQQAQSPTPMGINCTDSVYQGGQDGWLWWVWNWFRSWFWGPAVSLHDCMAAFFSADELKGDNMYSCEKCNKLRNGIKYSRVLALPEMLCVHLKRFRHDLSYSSKISSPVNFPLTGLDMRPYLHKECNSDVSSYDLTAVICHHGTVGSGHYTSFAKHELTGKWFEFDDQLVTEVNPDVVQNCQAYVLFYRKSNPQMVIIRSQAEELAEMNPPQASDIRFFVSRQWINRFNTFAEPGPIDNWAILCPHGGLPPSKVPLIPRLAVPLPQPLWDFLYKKFGGGPACNRLFECDTCRRAAESLSRRQEAELEAFTKYNNEFQYQDQPTTIYAISMEWFRQWQLFARGVTVEEPGPVNNSAIAGTSGENQPIRNVRPGSDYAQLNTTLWKFFHGLYGGGPEIILRGSGPEETKIPKEKDYESMEIEQELSSPKIVSEMDSVRSMVTSTSGHQNQTPQLKVTKNVSFDDDPEEIITDDPYDCAKRLSKQKKPRNIDDDNEEDVSSTSTITNSNQNQQTTSNANLSSLHGNRRSKYPNQIHEIVSKKDKKYRSAMKSSGLFGAEGKYYTQKTDNIPGPPSIITTTTTITNATTILDQIPSSNTNNINPNPSPSIPKTNFQVPSVVTNGQIQQSDSVSTIPTTKTQKRTAATQLSAECSLQSKEPKAITGLHQAFQASSGSIKSVIANSDPSKTTGKNPPISTAVELHPQNDLIQLKSFEALAQESVIVNNNNNSINTNTNIKISPVHSRKTGAQTILNGGVSSIGHNSKHSHRKKYKTKNLRKSANSSSYVLEHGSDSF